MGCMARGRLGRGLTVHSNVKPAFHGACFGAVSAPTLSARVPRRARAAFEKERFHNEHSSCFHGADCRAD